MIVAGADETAAAALAARLGDDAIVGDSHDGDEQPTEALARRCSLD